MLSKVLPSRTWNSRGLYITAGTRQTSRGSLAAAEEKGRTVLAGASVSELLSGKQGLLTS